MIASVSPLVAELQARAAAGRPVTIGLAGCGQMGTDIVVQLNRMPGLRLGAIAEMRPEAARAAALLAGFDAAAIAEVGKAPAIDSAIEQGLLAITGDLEALARAGRIDVVIDATGNPNVGTSFALDAIANGKHVVMLNVEADITIGRYLHGEARKAGRRLYRRRRRRARRGARTDRLRPVDRPRHRLRRQGQEQPAEIRRHPRRL